MERGARVLGAGAVVAVGLVVFGGDAAGADVVKGPGGCVGTGTWEGGGFTESSTDHVPSDVIEIPQADTVDWFGSIGGADLGAEVARRDIDGHVDVALPFGSVTIDDWDGSSVRAANEGTHDYDLPDYVIGIELTLSGEHAENGEVVCSGEVGLVVEGDPTDNPLAFVGIGGTLIFGAGTVFAGRPRFTKVAPAFEDVNPG